jgi:hypothetical protein
MYKYIINRFPDLKDALLADFSIITDGDGRPLAIGDRGVSASMVKRTKNTEN